MSEDRSNNISLESHLSDEKHTKLDIEELLDVLGAKDIMGRVYRQVLLEECANTQDHMNEDDQLKTKQCLEKIKYHSMKFKLKLKMGAISVHKKAYLVLFKQ